MGRILFTPVLVLMCAAQALASASSAPAQPAIGPGGSDYLHASVTQNGPYWAEGHDGDNSYKYYIFEPAAPTPASAPVVLFLHGVLATTPDVYGHWIRHIVRKGYVVVWVQYHGLIPRPRYFADNAMVAWKDALKVLNQAENHVRPEKDWLGRTMTAMVGHSAGGFVAPILADRAADWRNKIPKPRAVVAIEPGGVGIIPDEGFGDIDRDTDVVIVVGDEDDMVCKSTGVALWNSIPQIADENRDFLLVQSDYSGEPAQIANHYFPNTSGNRDTAAVDARDFFVTYKLSVAAFNCAFRGTECGYALGNGILEQVDMGFWGDGAAVEPMLWVEDPNLLQTSCRP